MLIIVKRKILVFIPISIALIFIIGFNYYYSNTIKCFSVVIPPFNESNYISRNIQFFSDGSFTVGNDIGVSDDLTGKQRYGYVFSYLIKSDDYFNSIAVKVDKSNNTNGYVGIEFRAIIDKNNVDTVTNWSELKGVENEISFLPNKQYRYIQFRVTFVSEPFKPIIKSIYIKACK
jgi:hypothetical protein